MKLLFAIFALLFVGSLGASKKAVVVNKKHAPVCQFPCGSECCKTGQVCFAGTTPKCGTCAGTICGAKCCPKGQICDKGACVVPCKNTCGTKCCPDDERCVKVTTSDGHGKKKKETVEYHCAIVCKKPCGHKCCLDPKEVCVGTTDATKTCVIPTPPPMKKHVVATKKAHVVAPPACSTKCGDACCKSGEMCYKTKSGSKCVVMNTVMNALHY